MSLSTLIHYGCQFILTLIIARDVGPHLVGAFVASMLIINVARIFTELGFPQSLIKLDALNYRDRNSALFVAVSASTLVALLILAFVDELTLLFGIQQHAFVLKSLLIILFLNAIYSTYSAWLSRMLRYRDLALANILSAIFGYVFVGGFGGLFGIVGIDKLIFATIAFFILNAIMCAGIVLSAERAIKLGVGEFRQFATFNTQFTSARIANFIALEADNVIVGSQLGPAQLGIYSRAYQFMTLPATLIGTIGEKVLFPLYARQSRDRTLESLVVKLRWIGICSFPMTALVLVFSDEIVAIALGDEWANVSELLRVLSVLIYFRIATKFIDSAVRAIGLMQERAYVQYFYAASVIGSVSVAVSMGMHAVTYAVAACVVTNYFLLVVLLRIRADFDHGPLHSSLVVLFVICWSIFL